LLNEFSRRIFKLLVAVSVGMCLIGTPLVSARDAQEKTNAGDAPAASQSPANNAEGSRRDVQARLNAAEKSKPPTPPQPIQEVEKTLFATHQFEQAAISPDGKQVAWVETLNGKDGAPSGKTAIYVSEIETKAAARRLSVNTAPSSRDHQEGNLVWAPDSKRIAFLSDAAKPGQLQLYMIGAAGGVAKKLTSVVGFLATPKFSPDGKIIAVLFTENATRAAGPLVAETPESGEIKDAFYEQRLAVVDVSTGKLRQISPADTYVYEYDWSPDGLRFAVSAALGNGDNNWWIAELYTLEAPSGLMKSIYKPHYQIANPVWSPKGDQIAFVEGLMSDAGLTGGDIFTISGSGGEAINITPGMKASASWLAWTPDEKLMFVEWIGGDVGIATVDPQNKKVASLWRGGEYLTAGSDFSPAISLAGDGATAAFVRKSFRAPPEVWAGRIDAWKPITHRNEGIKPAWGDAKGINWENGGHGIQGWLLYPKNFDATKKYPLVVSVHGGPSWASPSSWPSPHGYAAALAGAGYFVLFPNPRGSFGQGEAFTRANVKEFGEGDFADILAGVDEVLRIAPIDANRLGLTGWSYGGFMTMFGITQTKRFKAAMSGAGISNWQSYYGENLIDQWMIPFFGTSVYDDPEIYAKSSAINFIKKVKTPTLILVGDSDGECPTPQSYEFWHALKAAGVETQLVVYEHEGHMFAKPEHQRDRIERTLAWFDEHLK
jgi:dipeptidyl aminopeptidase/acylaminoacyl peptidase